MIKHKNLETQWISSYRTTKPADSYGLENDMVLGIIERRLNRGS